MKKLIIIIAVVLFNGLGNESYSQSDSAINNQFNKNTIHGNVGYALVYLTGTVNYERVLKQNMGKLNISTFAKIGVGAFEVWGGSGSYTLVQIGLLTGKGTHHLELSGGGLINTPFYGYGDGFEFPVSGNFGWRIQKPGGNSVFRLGVGYPEAVYVGYGISF